MAEEITPEPEEVEPESPFLGPIVLFSTLIRDEGDTFSIPEVALRRDAVLALRQFPKYALIYSKVLFKDGSKGILELDPELYKVEFKLDRNEDDEDDEYEDD